jgi:hypothetical protein
MGPLTWFLLGAAAPTLIKHSKPYARRALDKGLRLTHGIQRTIVELREDLQDLMAEASAAVNARANRAGAGDM